MHKISIIVPIYNSEKTLSRCVNSLISQTYPEIEIILINDGSTDNSYNICQNYVDTNARIKLFNKPNGGLGSARNAGINNCTGDYICFVDSDDWVDPDFVEILYSLCQMYDADISSVGIDVTNKYHINKSLNRLKADVICSEKQIIQYYYKETLVDSNLFSVCSSIFRKKTIDSIRFRERKLNEDMDFKLKVLMNSNKWVMINDQKYHYFQAGDSLSSGIVKKGDFDLLESTHILLDMANKLGCDKCVNYAYIATKKNYFSLLIRLAIYGCNQELNRYELEKLCIKELRNNYYKLISSPIKLSRKILITMFCINYTISKYLLQCMYKLM